MCTGVSCLRNGFHVVTALLWSKSRTKHSSSVGSGELGQELTFILSSVQKSFSSSQKGPEDFLADLQHYKKLRTEPVTFSSDGKHFLKICFWASEEPCIHLSLLSALLCSPKQNLISQVTPARSSRINPEGKNHNREAGSHQ